MRKFILINSRLERAHSSQCSAEQCSTIKNYKYVKQQMILFPITRNSSRVRQPLWVSRENVTALLHWLQDLFQIKIENICLFKLIKKNMETSLKTGFAQIFSCCPKKSELPKTSPPACTSMNLTKIFQRVKCPGVCPVGVGGGTWVVLELTGTLRKLRGVHHQENTSNNDTSSFSSCI